MTRTQNAALVVALIIGAIIGWVTAPYAWTDNGYVDTRVSQVGQSN